METINYDELIYEKQDLIDEQSDRDILWLLKIISIQNKLNLLNDCMRFQAREMLKYSISLN